MTHYRNGMGDLVPIDPSFVVPSNPLVKHAAMTAVRQGMGDFVRRFSRCLVGCR
jgi:hypothetical protein